MPTTTHIDNRENQDPRFHTYAAAERNLLKNKFIFGVFSKEGLRWTFTTSEYVALVYYNGQSEYRVACRHYPLYPNPTPSDYAHAKCKVSAGVKV